MKAFVTGVGGQLGHDVMDELAKRGYEATGSDILESVPTDYPYVQLDITDAEAGEKAISEAKPDVVKKWTMPLRNWGKVLGELEIMYPDRIS